MILERITGNAEKDVDQLIVPHAGQHGLECVPTSRIECFIGEPNKEDTQKTPLSRKMKAKLKIQPTKTLASRQSAPGYEAAAWRCFFCIRRR